MKKVLLLALVSCFSLQMSAQKWVSTTAQNKKVILEEFTGIHCGYCPDGHKRANDLVNANPGNVFLINIHSGGYAVPSQTGDPDLRTTAGTAIDAASSVAGYPAGNINRTKSPWSEGRGTWATTAAGILTQSSPVNVAVKSIIDPTTRTLTTEVEAYYTSASAVSTNRITIALTQDNILGPQSDYGNYNPTNWVVVNGVKKYKHNHVLRQMITSGTYGESIDTTTKGYYFYRKYTTTIPASYLSIDCNIKDLKVVAFVSEGNGNILSGAETIVDIPATIKADLGLTNQTPALTNNCISSVNPKIEVTNNDSKEITSFDVICNINGTDYKKSFSGSLKQNDKTTLDWGNINFTKGGNYTITFSGFTKVNNDALTDWTANNDFASISGIGFLDKATNLSNTKAGFEGGLDANFALDNTKNPKVLLSSSYVSATTNVGAHGSHTAMLYMIHSSWNVAGLPGDIIFGESDLSGTTAPYLTYWYAYSDKGGTTGTYGGTRPQIITSVSEDCGANWTVVSTISAQESSVNSISANALYIPTSSEYVWMGVSLAAYKGKQVLVKLSGVPGSGGNAMYIDDINLAEATGISEKQAESLFNIYPNPANQSSKVNFMVKGNKNVSLDVINVNGQTVQSVINHKNLTEGNYNFDVNTSTLAEGVYMVKLTVGDKTFNQRLSVVR